VNYSLRRLVQESPSSTLLPVFLLPCLANSHQARGFSSSRTRYSRVGGAAISVPPEVSLRFFDLPKTNLRSRKKDVPVSAVEVAGPLGISWKHSFGNIQHTDPTAGQMTLPLPPYVSARHNTENKKVTLSVGDPTITHQRAMWGS
jgi:large subunit ribosomal protein L6